MRNHYLTRGLVLVVIGVILLLYNVGVITRIPWTNLMQLWPLFLVAFGLHLLFSRGVLAFLAPLLVVVTIAVAFLGFPPQLGTVSRDYIRTNFQRYETATYSGLRLQGLSVADVRLRPLPAESELTLDASVPGWLNARWTQESVDSEPVYTLRGHSAGTRFWPSVRSSRPLELALSPDVLWDVSLQAGVANGRLNLEDIQWRSVSVEAGVVSLRIETTVLKQPSRIQVQSGVGQVTLVIPQEQPARITTSGTPSFLNNVSAQGFVSDNGAYVTEGFADAPNPLDIAIEGGITNLRVSRR